MLRQELKLRKWKSPEHNFCCVNATCSFNLDTDVGKYEPVPRRGKMRVKLTYLTETIYYCPKCKSQHLVKDFKNEEATRRVKDEKRQLNIDRLRESYH